MSIPKTEISGRKSLGDTLSLELLSKTRLSFRSIAKLKQFAATLAVGKDKRVSGRISGELLAAVKHRLGAASDTGTIEMALVNMVIADDFGTWLVDQAGRLDEDFDLGL